MTIIHAPPNYLNIDQLWAFISSDETGEGLCAAPINGAFLPMIAADEARVNSLIEMAKELAKVSGKKIKLVKFSLREQLMEFEP